MGRAMRRNLEEIICCPNCKRPVQVAARVATPSCITKSGDIWCCNCDQIVGRIRNFQFDFLPSGPVEEFNTPGFSPAQNDGLQQLPWEVTEEALSPSDPRLEWHGQWVSWSDGSRMSEGLPGDRLRFCGQILDASCRLLRHPWSGHVRFLVDGREVGGADLYHPDESVVCWFPIAHDLSPETHSIEIVPAGTRSAAAQASQVFFHELIVTVPDPDGRFQDGPSELNRVLPIFPSVLELLKEVPANGWILDCGGGDRRLSDPRYVNVDAGPYQLPSIRADVLKLPLRSDSVDFVFSQALLEHVRDPFLAAREMIRVTKPGGKIWSGMAFLQPVHAVPGHYFNATVWGLEELFRDVEILESSWFGELSFTIEWLLRASGATAKMPTAQYEEILSLIRPLDSIISYDALRAVASGVSVLARKPS